MYSATTQAITVNVTPVYLEEHSDANENYYVWAYTVRIQNARTHTVRLISRHWIITDALGHVEHVQGPGVVGEQPAISPGESFEYTSGCPLTTPSGLMVGSYEMTDPAGETFEVNIPAFSLDSPHQKQPIN